MIPNVHPYSVKPNLPARLSALHEIASNLWWSWNQEAVGLFFRLDADLWAKSYHSPLKVLGQISQQRLQDLLNDEGFLAQLDRVKESFDRYIAEKKTWFGGQVLAGKASADMRVAYFSAEFGIHESVPTYSGGLGCLAGDHLKSASDLAIPLVAVGLAYRLGYFQQYLSADGWQQESYPENDFYNMPFELQRNKQGDPIHIDIRLPGRLVYAQVWKVPVGRVTLLLLDTNIERNSPDDRLITDQLYGGDREMRIKQEILLGIGGIRALEALSLSPTVTHINEGHAAFAALERLRLMLRQGIAYDKAYELVHATNLFTTHTPVPAGNEVFARDLIQRYMGEYAAELGLSMEQFLALGQEKGKPSGDSFGMTVLALKMATYSNGVAKLHGVVARDMWQPVWPGVPKDDIPITSVTNGVHLNSWVSNEMGTLYERYLGPRYRTEPWDEELWSRVDAIPDSELWRSHERRRERLVAFARTRLSEQLRRRGAPESELRVAQEVLDPEVLTFGFARRFATYKRATLIMRDLERLSAILNNKERPCQILVAGKAHPHDTAGKELIKQFVRISRQTDFQHRIVFLENYDINVGRYLVQGVDVWLNNPRRPLEASGTSGMKVSANGGLNCSILDGWWDEGYAIGNGWAIGRGEEYHDTELQDAVEARALYELLEKEVAPLFYDRGADGVPHGWVRMMKESIKSHSPMFNTDRMVQEYTTRFYAASSALGRKLEANALAGATDVAAWRHKLVREWHHVKVQRVETPGGTTLRVGDKITVHADINLGAILPSEVSVDLYYGQLDSYGHLNSGSPVPMRVADGAKTGRNQYRFEGEVPCDVTGRSAFAIRVLPYHPNTAHPYEPGLVVWG